MLEGETVLLGDESETCEIDDNACFFSLLYTTYGTLTTHTRASLTHALLTYYLRSLAAPHNPQETDGTQMARSPVCSASGRPGGGFTDMAGMKPASAELVLQCRLSLRRAEEGVELIVGHGGAAVLERVGLRLELRRREIAKSHESVTAR